MGNNKKTILVTGGSRGIGFEITSHLLKDENLILLNYKNETKKLKRFISKNKPNIVPIKADLTKPQGIKKLLNETLNQTEIPDVIINNAGIALSAPLSYSKSKWEKTWDETISLNLKAPSIICREIIQKKIKTKNTKKLRIINIASRAAFRGETEDFIAYAASKGGLISLTKTLARSFGGQNVLAFSIAPGFVKTSMAEDFIKKYGKQHAMEGIVLNRLTEPKDIAPTVKFIAQGNMDHATGSTIDINGGSYLR